MSKIVVLNTQISVLKIGDEDYISLTDMAGGKAGDSRAADIIKNWLRARYALEFLGTWESLNNPDFKVVEFDHFKSRAGLPSFVLSATERLVELNAVAKQQMRVLGQVETRLLLK